MDIIYIYDKDVILVSRNKDVRELVQCFLLDKKFNSGHHNTHVTINHKKYCIQGFEIKYYRNKEEDVSKQVHKDPIINEELRKIIINGDAVIFKLAEAPNQNE